MLSSSPFALACFLLDGLSFVFCPLSCACSCLSSPDAVASFVTWSEKLDAGMFETDWLSHELEEDIIVSSSTNSYDMTRQPVF
jgi:hypothetical protein